METIADICRRYQIRELAIFGSAARGDMRPDSDVDIMVELEPGTHPGLRWMDMEDELEAIFGRRIDAMQKKQLKPRILAEAEREAVVLYGSLNLELVWKYAVELVPELQKQIRAVLAIEYPDAADTSVK